MILFQFNFHSRAHQLAF